MSLTNLDICELFDEALAQGQEVICRVSSGSMHPTFQIGDILIVDSQKPLVGDVAVFREAEQWVTHRVIACEAEGLLLRGDAMPQGQSHFVKHSDVIGRVISKQRDATSWLIWLGRWAVRVVPRPVRQRLPTLLRLRLRSRMSMNQAKARGYRKWP